MHDHVKVAFAVAKALIAEVRGVDLSDVHERIMVAVHERIPCFTLRRHNGTDNKSMV